MRMLVRVSLVLLSWFCMGSKGQLLDYENWADQAALSGGLCRYGNSVECCWGWRQADQGRCQPHCQQGCKHGECVGPERCKCHPGYTGKACNQDLNECGLKPRPCKHRCMNTPGSYKCYCLDGYTLQPDGSCRNARTCYHANCQYGCEVIKGAVRCTCPSPGLQLGPDRRTCIDIDECVSGGGVCPRRRKCVNTFGSFVCNCHLGFKLLYINGRYTCVDKDTRPFCSLNPSSPKCRCKDGNCKAPPKVTLEPQRPRTTPIRTTTPPTTTATTTPLTTTTTTTPPTTTTTTTPPTTTTTTTPLTTTTTTTPPTTTTTTTPPTTTTTTTPPTTMTTTTTTISTTPPTTTTTTTTTTTLVTTTSTPKATTPAAPTSTAAATSPLAATTTTTTTTAPPTTTATTTMTTKAATTTPKATTPTPATTALAATTTFVTTTSPSSTPSTTSTATTTFITTAPTMTTSTSTTLPTTTKLDTTTLTSPTPPPPPATATFTTTAPTITTSTSTTQPTLTELDTTTPTTPAPPTPAAPTTTTTTTTTTTPTTTTTTTTVAPTTVMLTTVSLITTSTNNKVKLRGDVHIPRHPNHNHVWEFDIELGNTADYARDDPQVGLLQCTFDHGVCDWMSDREGDLHWETTHRPAGGWYLSVPELKAGQKSVRGARLAVQIGTSWSRDVVCFSFSHWLTGHHVGVLQLFVRAKGRNQRYSTALWSRTGGHGWRHTQVTLTTHSVDRVLLKAERRQGRRGLIAVDDVTLRQGACR